MARRLFPHRLSRPVALVCLATLLPLGALVPAIAASPLPHPAPRHGPAAPASQVVRPARPVRTALDLPPRLTATAAVLMDARTGQVLYGRSPYLVWPPASTTKIMTALVALESTSLETPVLITPPVAHFRVGSVVGLPEGARIPLHDLLYGLLLPSGNDVALAVAEGVAGTIPAFVARMNSEARRLGALDTHFTSPHGLYDQDHYSTAYDLALITRAAMQNATFREIVRTPRWWLALPGEAPRLLWNHNRLLTRYAGADGVKTGYVHQAGQTLVASATRDGWRLIAVLLHSGDEWGDASRLLSYGFAHYRSVELARAGEQLAAVAIAGAPGTVPGVVTHDVYGVLAPGEVAVRRIRPAVHLALPVRRGEQVGAVEFYASGRLVGSAQLVSPKDVGIHTALDLVIEWVSQFVTRSPREVGQ